MPDALLWYSGCVQCKVCNAPCSGTRKTCSDKCFAAALVLAGKCTIAKRPKCKFCNKAVEDRNCHNRKCPICKQKFCGSGATCSQVCGSKLTWHKQSKKYKKCSVCHELVRADNPRYKGKHDKRCKVCGKRFCQTGTITCSSKCGLEWSHRQNRQRWKDPTKAKATRKIILKKWTLGARQALSVAQKKQWSNPEYRRSHLQNQVKWAKVVSTLAAICSSAVAKCSSYRNRKSQIRVTFSCGHVWTTTWDKIRILAWSKSKIDCPTCFPSYLHSEEEVRRTLERLTGLKWPRANPSEVSFLHGLHLDGYCRGLKSAKFPNGTAFERQGEQHYKLVSLGGKRDSLQELAKRKRRDWRKKYQCWYHGIRLIKVPYWIKDLESYLGKKLANFTNKRMLGAA